METITASSPLRIGSMVLKNRLVMTPMNTNYSDSNGCLTRQMEEYYVRRAAGGVGLIILEAVSVAPDSRNHGVQPMLYDEKFVPAWFNLVERLQQFGAKVAVEIAHFGAEATLSPRCAPSNISRFSKAEIEVLSRERIEEIQDAFVRTAVNAKKSGMDAVVLHGAHGYLIGEFLSPLYNRRTDEYGGSIENRTRFVTEILRKIRENLGQSYPVWVRYSVDEFAAGGRDTASSVEIAKILERAGASAIDLSAGIPNSYIFTNPPYGLGDTSCMLIDKAYEVKKAVGIPVICANSIRSRSEIDQILQTGKADLIGLARPLLADPDFPQKIINNQDQTIRPCLSCQYCFQTLDGGKSLRCAVNPETGREYLYRTISLKEPKKILVVGAGPAGMEAARVCALEGHKVVLCEKERTLGGTLIAAAVPPNKERILKLIAWYGCQMQSAGVNVRLGTEVTPDLICDIQPDVVISACGAEYLRNIPGSKKEHVLTVKQALQSPEKVGRSVLIIGGGASGCECAEYLAGERIELKWQMKEGVDGALLYEKTEHNDIPEKHVITVVELLPQIGSDMDAFNRELMEISLTERNVAVLTGTEVVKIRDHDVIVSRNGSLKNIAVDTVVLAAGLKSRANTILKNSLTAGDQEKPGRIGDAIFSAYALSRRI